MSSLKSAPTENWDDDFLFQLTPSRPKPVRRSVTQRESGSFEDRRRSDAYSTFGDGKDDARRAVMNGNGNGNGNGDDSPRPGLKTRKTLPGSISIGSDLDFFGDEEQDTVGLGLSDASNYGRGKETPQGAYLDPEEEDEDWDTELGVPGREIEMVGSHSDGFSQSISGSVVASGSGGSTLLHPPPMQGPSFLPSGSGSYPRQNISQTDLRSKNKESTFKQEQEQDQGTVGGKKGFRKSYHGQTPASAANLAPPLPILPSLGPRSRSGSGSAAETRNPPSAFQMPLPSNALTGKGSIGKGKEKNRMGMMERVVSLHKRFSSTSASGAAGQAQAQAQAQAQVSGSDSRSNRNGNGHVQGQGGRKPSLKVDTDRPMYGSIVPPGRPTSTPRMPTAESNRSILTMLSTTSSASSGLVDGLPGSRRPSGSSGMPTSPSLVSVGFHLPSPSPASPYYQHQHRFEAVDDRGEGMEEVLDVQKTPRRASAGRRSEDVVPSAPGQVGQGSGRTVGTVGTAQTVYMMDDMEKEVAKMDADRMKGFKMGSPPALARLPSNGRRSEEKPLPPAVLPLPLDKKRKSTLKRLSSMSKRHGRKVSDGWRFVSGSSNSSASTFERKSSDSVPGGTPRTAPVSFAMQQQQQERVVSPPLPPLGSAFRLASPLEPSHTSTSARSMRQTPSATSSRISSDPQALRSPAHDVDAHEDRQRSPSSAGRRVSLSDLKIPSRVASSQKGVREGALAVRQFAACVKDLKALLAQRAVLEAKFNRTQPSGQLEVPGPPATSDDFAPWWEKAQLIIELSETGSTASQPSTPAIINDVDLKRERRITLAADSSSSPNFTNIPMRRSQTELKPLDTNLPRMDPMQRSESSVTANSAGSMGRQEFSKRQMELLREILNTPAGTARVDQTVGQKVFGAVTEQRSQRIPVRSSRSSAKENRPLPLDLPLPPASAGTGDQMRYQQLPLEPKMTKRRSSRSGFFNLRDMWRTTSHSNVNADVDVPRTPVSPIGPDFDQSLRMKMGLSSQASSARSPKSPGRPGLAGMFRKSSQSSGLLLDPVSATAKRPVIDSASSSPVTSNNGAKPPNKMQALRRKSSRMVSRLSPSPADGERIVSASPVSKSDRSSTSSSLSDWDKPDAAAPVPGPRVGQSGSKYDPSATSASPEATDDRDRTVGRSDSRRVLANLGVRPGAGSPRPVFGPVSTAHDVKETLLMTPENLLPLLDQAKSTVEKCEQSLRAVGYRAEYSA